MEDERLNFPTPFDKFLYQNRDLVHAIIQDMLNCKIESIRKTSVHDMEPILNLFRGSTLNKKRESLIEFLGIMPEYKTNDKDLLYERLKKLKAQIKQEGYADLLYYALYKYRNTSANESDA